jgi:hypothetical protein
MAPASPVRAATATAHYLNPSELRAPEYMLMIAGPVLFTALFFIPWFTATGSASINGHHGAVTGWQTYGPFGYFLLWCAVGSYILPWIVARGHELGWDRGELTSIHGLIGIGVLLLFGLGFRPGHPSGLIRIDAGYWIALLALLALVCAGAARARLTAGPARKPPGAI